MNFKLFLYSFFIFSSFLFSQKAEKFKPSKIVTISVIDVEKFNQVECIESFDYYFEKGSIPQVKFETHENMHEFIQLKNESGILKFNFLEKPKVFKKLKITIFYNDDLNQIISKDEANVYAFERLKLKDFSIYAQDKSKLFINADFDKFELNMDHKTKGEMNINSSQTKVICSKNASLIAMINAKSFQFDGYQNSSITLEGESDFSKIRTSNSANFLGKKFNVKHAEVHTDLSSSIGVFSIDTISINSTGDSKLYLYGNPKIEIIKFEDNSSLFKKSKI